MPQYDYIAVNEAGQKMTGQAEGPNTTAVRDQLRQTGWTVFSIQEVRVLAGGLSASDSVTVTQHLVLATQAGLPLSGALRALAEEASSSGLKRNLRPLYEALERGEPLEKVLLDPALRLPPGLGMILGSGLPAPAISQLLIHTIQIVAELRGLRTKILTLLSYPASILLALCGLWIFLVAYVTPMYADLLEGFGVDVNPGQRWLENLSRTISNLNWTWFVPVPFVLTGVLFLLYYLLPIAVRYKLWNSIPFVGSMYRLAALSNLAQTLAVMLEFQVPLPRSLTFAAAGLQDPELQFLCRRVASRVQSGEHMDVIISAEKGLPAYLEQILRWTLHGQNGSEPLKGLAQMLLLRARSLAQSAIPMLEPIIMIVAVISLIFYAVTLIPPAFSALNMLA
jgi:type II secretory pathway component PulF